MTDESNKTVEQRLEYSLRETTKLNEDLKEKREALATVGRELQRLEVQKVEDHEWELERRRMARIDFRDIKELRTEEAIRSITRLSLYEREVQAKERIATALTVLAEKPSKWGFLRRILVGGNTK